MDFATLGAALALTKAAYQSAQESSASDAAAQEAAASAAKMATDAAAAIEELKNMIGTVAEAEYYFGITETLPDDGASDDASDDGGTF